MGQDEQDAILGRVTREYYESQQALVLIDAELEAFEADLGKLIGFVNGHVRRTARPSDVKLPEFPGTVSKYIDPSKLNALLEEQDLLLNRIRSLVATLNEFRL